VLKDHKALKVFKETRVRLALLDPLVPQVLRVLRELQDRQVLKVLLDQQVLKELLERREPLALKDLRAHKVSKELRGTLAQLDQQERRALQVQLALLD
jgi:hypothetical protein